MDVGALAQWQPVLNNLEQEPEPFSFAQELFNDVEPHSPKSAKTILNSGRKVECGACHKFISYAHMALHFKRKHPQYVKSFRADQASTQKRTAV